MRKSWLAIASLLAAPDTSSPLRSHPRAAANERTPLVGNNNDSSNNNDNGLPMHVSVVLALFTCQHPFIHLLTAPSPPSLTRAQRPQSYPSGNSMLHPPEGRPTIVSSFYWLMTNSWLNLLLVFVPLGIVAEKMKWDAVWIFSLNFLAIMPLAKVSARRGAW